MRQTLLHALRQLGRSAGFSFVAILMIGLGIGMSTSAFSLTNLALLSPLPVPDGHRLVRIFRTAPESPALLHSPANFLDLRAGATVFQEIAASHVETVNVSENGGMPEQSVGLHVTANFLTLMGVQPFLGRNFARDEDQPGAPGVVILTYDYWMHRFAGDPAILGRTLRVNGENLTVVGVLPQSFHFPRIWSQLHFIRPLTLWPHFSTLRHQKWYDVAARLKPGVTLEAAQAELSTIAARLANDHPADNSDQGVRAVPFASSNIRDNTRKTYWLVTGLAVLVLVIACANLASVQLARAFRRSHELAIRSALGASRFALMRPLLAESVLLSIAGGATGLLIARWVNQFIATVDPAGGPAIPIDGRVIVCAALTALITGVMFGLAPAWLASRVSCGDALKESSRGGTSGRVQQRLKSFLVAGQLGVALVLVSAALSFGVAVKRTLRQDLGWQPGEVFTGFASVPYAGFPDDAGRRAFTRLLHARLSALPGVTGVSISLWTPAYDYKSSEALFVEGHPPSPAGREPLALTNAVDRHFFDLLKIPLKAGRLFGPDVTPESRPVVIVNEATARRFWPGESAVSKRVRFAPDGPWAEVIGVVGDLRMAANFNEPVSRLQVYRPLEHRTNGNYSFVVASAVRPETLATPIRKAIATIHEGVTLREFGPMRMLIERMLAGNDFLIAMLGAFAGVGLIIAMIGLYGVMSQLTAQRRREIGVRLALGADRSAILRLVLAQGGRVIAGGLIAGLLGTFVVTALYRRTMPELALPGVALQISLAVALCIVGLLACYLPARGATRVDPALVLRDK